MTIDDVLKWLSSPSDGLRNRILHGGVWSILLNSSSRIVQLVKTIVLARILAPEAFGIVGIGVLVMTAVDRFTDPGFDEALVQHEKDSVDDFLGTTWGVNLVRGVLLAVILFLAGPLVAWFFDEPSLTPVIRVFAIIPLFKALTNPAVVYFRKDLEFHRQFIFRFSGTATHAVVAIALGIWLQNLWALVLGLVVGEFVKAAVSFTLVDKLPRISFDRKEAAELWRFGKWMYGSVVVLFLIQSGDDLFVGWLLGASILGFYRLAFRFGNMPATEISTVILSVMFPAFSKLQDDRAKLRQAFEQVLELVYLTGLPLTIGIFLVARPFTATILGQKWLPMVPILQVMTLAGLVRMITTLGGGLFRGFGNPRLDFRMNMVRLCVIALTVWPLATRYGGVGVAVSITAGLFASLPYWFIKTREITGLQVREYVWPIVAPVIGCLIMIPPVVTILRPNVFKLLAAILVGIVVYWGVQLLLYRLLGTPRIDRFLDV